jgi:hypothetical protein
MLVGSRSVVGQGAGYYYAGQSSLRGVSPFFGLPFCLQCDGSGHRVLLDFLARCF